MDGLEVPQAPAGLRVERDEAVGEQVVAGAVAAEEVVARRADRDEDDAVFLVDRELAPVVTATGRRERRRGPGVGTNLTRLRDGMKHPRQLAGEDVISLHIRGIRLVRRTRGRQRDDVEVLVNASRIAGLQRSGRTIGLIQSQSQIDLAVDAK